MVASLLSIHIPLRFVRANLLRLLLTAVALGCAVALVGAIDLVNRAVVAAFREVVGNMAGRVALQVSAGDGAAFPEEIAERAAAVGGVAAAVPLVAATAFTADETGEVVTVYGVDIANDTAVRLYQATDAAGVELQDPLLFLSQPRSVLLVRAFAERRSLKVEDTITLDTPQGSRTFTIRGLLEPQGVARVYGGNLIVMDLYAAEQVFASPGLINRVDVVLRPEADVEAVATSLREALPAGIRVETPTQRKLNVEGVIRTTQSMLEALGLIVVGIAFLITFSRLTVVFERRTWQLGIMRALGLRRRALGVELLKEALLLGVAGVLLGIPLAFLLARILLPIIASSATVSVKLATPEAELAVRPMSLILASLVGIGTAVLAAFLPARRAARRALAETIRTRGVEDPAHTEHAGLLAAVVVVVAATVAVALQESMRSPGVGLAATVLTVGTFALAADPVVRLLTAASKRVGWIPLATRLAAVGLAQHPRRARLAVATIGIGVGTVGWLAILTGSFERSVVAAASALVRADLVITSTHGSAGFVEAPVSDALVAAVASVPGVRAVAGLRWHEWTHGGRAIAISAVDPSYVDSPAFGSWPVVGGQIADVWDAFRRGTAVLASSNFLTNFGVRLGDELSLDTPGGPLAVTVGGVYVDFASPGGTLALNREVFSRYWRDSQLTRIAVELEPSADPISVRSAIAGQFGRRYGLRILAAHDLISYFADQVHRAFAVVPVATVLVLAVVLVGLGDAMAAGILERRQELSVVRALGGRRGLVRSIVVSEALTIGVLGLAIAVGLATTLGALWVHSTLPYLFGWALDLHVPLAWSVTLVAATLALCLLAGVVPSAAASRPPAAALRYD